MKIEKFIDKLKKEIPSEIFLYDGEHPFEIVSDIFRDNILPEEKLFKIISDYHHLSYREMEEVKFSEEVLELMENFKNEYIREKKFLVLKKNEEKAEVAICNPWDIFLIDEIELKLGLPIKISVVSFSTFNYLQDSYLNTLTHEISDEIGVVDEQAEMEDLTNEENPIVKLVNNILGYAVRNRASDIHIEPYSTETRVKSRIDGVLIEGETDIPRKYHQMIVSRIKILSSLNIAEHRIPQDGRFKKILDNREIDFRVSVLPTVFGESVVIRILDKKDEILSLEKLGFSFKEREMVLKNGFMPHGMILVTGPTGSGKTTTLYAVLKEINKRGEKIITIEDPVEYQLNNVVQIPVNEKTGLTFAKGLRSILRQDPDKIMVGEIRDRETAEIAIQAALTGHLVMTTLHSNSTTEAIGRLINIGVDPYQFSTALNLIIGQSLVRKMCTNCNGDGCSNCNYTGYYGRTGIYEILQMDEELKEMVTNGDSLLKIKRAAKEKGMDELYKSAQEKVKDGITTKEEYERVIGRWFNDL